MDCPRSSKDLVSINQKLFLGLNPRKDLKRKSGYKEKNGWKAYDTNADNVKNHLIAENMVRKDKKKRLDFTAKAINPAVYPNFGVDEIVELGVKRSEPAFKEFDIVSKNIERGNVLDEQRQTSEREESLSPILETKRGNNGPLSALGRQKYFIAQVRNYLPLVKNSDTRGKLKLLLKYLHNTSSAKELSINERGHVQRGLFDTQTKFSDYLSYYVLPSEEKLHAKKPSFYNVILAEPLAEYLVSNKQQSMFGDDVSGNVMDIPNARSSHVPSGPKADQDAAKSENRKDDEHGYDSEGITPLRNIKDSDLRLETSLPKMISLLTSLNIDMTLGVDENDYEKLIDIAAFPIYATNPSRGDIYSKEKEYAEFGDMLRTLLKNGKGGTNETET